MIDWPGYQLLLKRISWRLLSCRYWFTQSIGLISDLMIHKNPIWHGSIPTERI